MGAKHKTARHIPERFLRQIWHHRLFAADNLQTTDGQRLEILSTGEINNNSGPDFLDARLRIGNLTFRGNVELHKHFSGWTDHGHQRDPLYNAVILHVVFTNEAPVTSPKTKSKREIPVLVLQPYLTSSYHELWKEMIVNERSERLHHLPCFGKNDNIDNRILRQWVQKLAGVRMELKVRRYERRLKDLITEQKLHVAERFCSYEDVPFGLNPEELPPPEPILTHVDFAQSAPWEQILFEGMMEALGYAKNREPMLKLAKNPGVAHFSTRKKNPSDKDSTLELEAMLFHMSGLLSAPLSGYDKESRTKVNLLRRTFENLQPPCKGEILHPTEWKFFRLRPENFPTIRLAGAARILARFTNKPLLKSIIHLLKDQSLSTRTLYKSLQEIFIVPSEGFWQTHYRFGTRTTSAVTTLIGSSRADDIILNTVIPISLLYARIFKETPLRRRIFRLLEECPPSSSNAILGTMESQLFRKRLRYESAMIQQGALQLYKSYCQKERCAECVVGK